MKIKRKVASCLALLTSASCLVASTGISASALNVTDVGVSRDFISSIPLSQSVFTVADTEINLVTANMAFEKSLTKYSYDSTNVSGNSKSVGFSISFTKDMSIAGVKVTNRVICDSILGELYESGNKNIFAEIHNYSSADDFSMGGVYVPITIHYIRGHYTPVYNCSDESSVVVPVNFSMFAKETGSVRDDEFYALCDQANGNVTGYFTFSKNCSLVSYEDKPVTYIEASSPVMLLSLKELEYCSLQRYHVDSSTGKVDTPVTLGLDILWASPKINSLLWRVDSADGTKLNGLVFGGYGLAINPDYSDSCNVSYHYFNSDSLYEETFSADEFFEKHIYIPGNTSRNKEGYSFLDVASSYDMGTVSKILDVEGKSAYYANLKITSPATENANETEHPAILKDRQMKGSSFKIEDGNNGVGGIYSIGRLFKKSDSASSFDVSATYGGLLQGVLTQSGESYLTTPVEEGSDGRYVIGRHGVSSSDIADVKNNYEYGDYFAMLYSGKLIFVTYDKDADGNYSLVQSGDAQDIREVVTDYVGGSQAKIQSEEYSAFGDGRALTSTGNYISSDEYLKEKKLFLPNLTYELEDGTDLVRVRLHYSDEIDAINNEITGNPGYSISDNDVYYIYDGSYDTPLEAYEAGASFYTVPCGDYDILLPTGDYKVSAITESEDYTHTRYGFNQIDLGTIYSACRDIDIAKLASGVVDDITLSESSIDIVPKSNGLFSDINLSSYVSNPSAVGGIKSIEFNKDIKQNVPASVFLRNGLLTGSFDSDTDGKAIVTITANNGTSVDLTINFKATKGTTTTETSVTTTTSNSTTTEAVTSSTESTSNTVDTLAALYGDANLDSKVDISDAVLLNKATAGSVQLNEQQKSNSDCDADGDISTNDSVVLLRFLVQLVDTLPSKD